MKATQIRIIFAELVKTNTVFSTQARFETTAAIIEQFRPWLQTNVIHMRNKYDSSDHKTMTNLDCKKQNN